MHIIMVLMDIRSLMSLILDGNLEVKCPTMWIDGEFKSIGGKSQRRRARKNLRTEKIGEEKTLREIQVHKKVGKYRNTAFPFPMVCGSRGCLLKQRVWSHLVGAGMKFCMLLLREADLEVKRVKNLVFFTIFEAQSRFASPNVENTSVPEQFS